MIPNRKRVDPNQDTISIRLEKIRLALKEIAKRRAEGPVQLGVPLALPKVEAFEQRHNVRIPEDFRRFVTELGNGGDGPAFHGWPAFDPDAPWLNCPEHWSLPFVHPRLAQELAEQELEQKAELAEPEMDEWERMDWEEEREQAIKTVIEQISDVGYINVGDHGCGIFDFLVVTGYERGHIWWSDDVCRKLPTPAPNHSPKVNYIDDTADSLARETWKNELLAADYSYRIDFIDYYGNWIEYLLSRLPKK